MGVNLDTKKYLSFLKVNPVRTKEMLFLDHPYNNSHFIFDMYTGINTYWVNLKIIKQNE